MDMRRLLIAGLAFGVGAVLARQLLTERTAARRRSVAVPALRAAAAARPVAPQVDAPGPAAGEAVPTDQAETAAAFRPAAVAPGDHADARLAPFRALQQPRRRTKGTLDAREPTETAARLELPRAEEEAVTGAHPAGYDDDGTAAARPDESDPDAPEDDPDPAAVARGALFFVGADPAAEAVWAAAINDPDRTAHERSDLIEDLNEEGLSDPQNPTSDDLPLIERRLALIEALAPAAMDETNAAAFAEAYKDLLNMRARAWGQ